MTCQNIQPSLLLSPRCIPTYYYLPLVWTRRSAVVHVKGFLDPTIASRLGDKLKQRDAADAAAGGASSWKVANGRGMESSGTKTFAVALPLQITIRAYWIPRVGCSLCDCVHSSFQVMLILECTHTFTLLGLCCALN
jgi:hypothetical protein